MERGQHFRWWLGRRIRTLRTERAWSPRDLSCRSGVDQVFIRSIEKGERNPTAATLAKVAEAFGLSLASLVEGAPSLLPDGSDRCGGSPSPDPTGAGS